MKRYLLASIILALVVLGMINVPYVYAESSKEITVIRKTVCFNVSISDPVTSSSVSKKICVVIDFHIRNIKNGTITVSFPVTINIGNKTITKTVVVPLDVYGEVVKIEVYAGKEGSESKPEEVIYVVPQEEKTTTSTKPKPSTTTTTTATKPHTTTPQKPVTITKTRTITKTIEKKEIPIEMKDVALIVAIIAVAGTLIFILLKRKPKEEKYEEKKETPTREEIEAYEEALKLARQQLEEKEQEIERLKKSFPYTLICPSCGNRVKPVITDDNRLLCPVCHGEIARIKPDGTLEFPSEERGKNGILRKSRNESNKKVDEEKRRDNKEARRGEQED